MNQSDLRSLLRWLPTLAELESESSSEKRFVSFSMYSDDRLFHASHFVDEPSSGTFVVGAIIGAPSGPERNGLFFIGCDEGSGEWFAGSLDDFAAGRTKLDAYALSKWHRVVIARDGSSSTVDSGSCLPSPHRPDLRAFFTGPFQGVA